MSERHVFAGNNTSKGFYSYFDYMFNPEEANRIYILKGGPGVGKSSFMKKFGLEMQSRGFFVEFVHCSSDNDSLDGIIVPSLKIAFVDGTAPHTIDPRIPGAADEIVNLGLYLDNRQLEKYKNEIVQINNETSSLYQSAYRYLKCAGVILDEMNCIYDKYTDDRQFTLVCEDLIQRIFTANTPVSSNSDSKQNLKVTGKVRKSFSESYTADGYITHTASLYPGNQVWAVCGKNMNYTSKLMDRIVSEAVQRGFDTECYYHPLHPEKLQHVLLPALNLLFTGTKDALSYKYDDVIDLSVLMDSEKLDACRLELDNNLNLYHSLINNAFKKLYETKKIHDLLEVFFINSMDFNGVNACFDNLLSQYKETASSVQAAAQD